MNQKGQFTSAFDWRAEFARLEGAYSPRTINGYYTDVSTFVDWCDAKGRTPFPASVETVAAFLTDQAITLVPSTVKRRLYAIRKAHQLLRFPDPTDDEEINITLRRIKRANPVRPRQVRGLTRSLLERFIESEPDTPWGTRNRALMSLGYDLLTRRSELVLLRTDDLEFQEDGTLSALIRRSKADPFGEGRLAYTSKRTGWLVRTWLQWRGPDIEFLFCPIHQGHVIDRQLGDTAVKDIIKDAARRTGLSESEVREFSGHSMRVGAAQDLLCAGHDTAAIMRAGGWKTAETLIRYLERAEHNVWR